MPSSHAFPDAFGTRPVTRPVTRLSLARDREPLHSSVVYLTKSKSLGYVPRKSATLGFGALNG